MLLLADFKIWTSKTYVWHKQQTREIQWVTGGWGVGGGDTRDWGKESNLSDETDTLLNVI